MANKYDDEQGGSGRGLSLTGPIAVVAGLLGIGLGASAGYALHAMVAEPEVVVPPPTVIKDQLSDEDMLALCEELTDDEKTKVIAAQERVGQLQTELQARESELAKMRKDAAGDEAKKKAASKKWREMEQEIARLTVALAEAEQERDQLKVELEETIEELTETKKELDTQIVLTRKYKSKAIKYKKESTDNLWSAFLANAKVQVCDRGTRKRHENCHEAVETAFSQTMRSKFSVCVDSYQAVPVLRQAEKDETLPQFAEWLPDDNKFTKKRWYVIYCDPTLPENNDLADIEAEARSEAASQPRTLSGGADADFNIDDIEEP